MVVSGIATAKFSKIDSRHLKYLNEVVLSMSVALASLCVGMAIGGGSVDALNQHNTVAAVALLVFALVIEGLLIAMVANSEFKNLGSLPSELPDSCKSMITALMVKSIPTVTNTMGQNIGSLLADFDPTTVPNGQQCVTDIQNWVKAQANNTDHPGKDAKTLIIVALVLNSIGLVGGIVFQFMETKRTSFRGYRF